MIAAAAVVAAFCLAVPKPAARRLAGFLQDALAPIEAPLARIKNALDRTVTPARRVTPAVYESLLAEVTRLRHERRRIESLDLENRQLRRMLDLPAPPGWRLLAADILARDVNAWWQTARLNRGSADGVAPDLPVLSPDGLVGRVLRVSRSTCDVLFLVDPRCKVSARVLPGGALGVVRGQGVSWRGQPGCRMEYLSPAAAVRPGDDVVSSGLGGVFPPGLLLGRIRRVMPDRSGLYQSAELDPAAGFQTLQMLFLILRDAAPPAESWEVEPP